MSRYQGSVNLNVFHYRLLTTNPAVLDGDDVVDAAIAVLQNATTGATPAFRELTNAGAELEALRYQWIWPVRYSPIQSALNVGIGLKDGEGLPGNLATVAIKRSIFAGGHGHGMTHLGAMTVGDTDGASVALAHRTLVGVFMNVMDTTIDIGGVLAGATLVPVIYNRADPADSAAWFEHNVETEVRIMRRRTLGVGI